MKGGVGSSKRNAILVALLVLILLTGGVGTLAYMKATEATQYAQEGQRHLEEALDLAIQKRFDESYASFREAERSLKAARSSLDSLNGLLGLFFLVPVIGPQLTAGERLINIGYAIAVAGQNLSTGLSLVSKAGTDAFTYLANRTAHSELRNRAVSGLSSAERSFEDMGMWVDSATKEERNLDVSAVPVNLQPAVLELREQLPTLKRTGGQLLNLTKAMAPLLYGLDWATEAQDELSQLDMEGAVTSFDKATANFTSAILILEATPRPLKETIPEFNALLAGILGIAKIGSYATQTGSHTGGSMQLMSEALAAVGSQDFQGAYEKLEGSKEGLENASEWAERALDEKGSLDTSVLTGFGDIASQLEIVGALDLAVTQLRGLTDATAITVQGLEHMAEAKAELERLRLGEALGCFTLAEQRFNEASDLLARIEKPPSTLEPIDSAGVLIETLSGIGQRLSTAGEQLSSGLEALNNSFVYASQGKLLETEEFLIIATEDFKASSNAVTLANASLQELRRFDRLLPPSAVAELNDRLQTFRATAEQLLSLAEGFTHAKRGLSYGDNARRQMEELNLALAEESYGNAAKEFSKASSILASIEVATAHSIPRLDNIILDVRESLPVANETQTAGLNMVKGLVSLDDALSHVSAGNYSEARGSLDTGVETLQDALRSCHSAFDALGALHLREPDYTGGLVNQTLRQRLALANLTVAQLADLSRATCDVVDGLDGLANGYTSLTALSYAEALVYLNQTQYSFNKATVILDSIATSAESLQIVNDTLQALKQTTIAGGRLSSAGYEGSTGLGYMNNAIATLIQRPAKWVETGDRTWYNSALSNVTNAENSFERALQAVTSANTTLSQLPENSSVIALITPLFSDLRTRVSDAKAYISKLQSSSEGLYEATLAVCHMDFGLDAYRKGDYGQTGGNFTQARKHCENASVYVHAANVSVHLNAAVDALADAAGLGEDAVKSALSGNLTLAEQMVQNAETRFQLAIHELDELF